jgi:hypothetical protein
MGDHLPLHPTTSDDEAGSCGPKAYVSYEEQHILAAIRDVKEQADSVRRELETADAGARHGLQARLEELRRQREELVVRREAAYRRKMIMLGHIEPTEEDLAAFPDLRP